MEKILIVDDDADIRRAFRRNLERDELQVVDASSGEEAISKWRRNAPTWS